MNIQTVLVQEMSRQKDTVLLSSPSVFSFPICGSKDNSFQPYGAIEAPVLLPSWELVLVPHKRTTHVKQNALWWYLNST